MVVCGLSKTSSLAEIENRYVYQLYEHLEKLIEAFFLLITGPALPIGASEEMVYD